MNAKFILVLALAVPLVVEESAAQGATGNRPGVLRPNRRLLQPTPQERLDGLPAARRQQVEQQIRRTLWRVAKQRIGLTDEQMLRLERTSQRFEQRRRLLAQRERVLRLSLRTEVLSDSAADQATISGTLDQLQALQRQRLDLELEEQKEFAEFMTPLQRAKFIVPLISRRR